MVPVYTSSPYPYIVFRSGNGHKIAFAIEMKPNGDFVAHSYKAHWKKVCDGKSKEVYKTRREVKVTDVIGTFRKMPCKSTVNSTIKYSK